MTEHARHTPGPWRAVDAPSRGWEVWMSNDSPVCHLRWTDGLRPQVEATVAADASLIAAAPELLAALKEMRAAYSSNAYSPNAGQRYASERADKAIAKAEASPSSLDR